MRAACLVLLTMSVVAAAQIGSGWDPHWQPATDVFANFADKDFRLGLTAAQTTLAAVGAAGRRATQTTPGRAETETRCD